MNFSAIGPKILTMTDKLCCGSYNKRIFLNRLIQHMRQGGLRKSVLPLFLSFPPPPYQHLFYYISTAINSPVNTYCDCMKYC